MHTTYTLTNIQHTHINRAFVTVVNEVGVDINLAADKPAIHSHPVQFISGFGPRKASELLQLMRQKGCLHYREQLLEEYDYRTFIRRCVWTNAAAFLRITKNSSMWDDELDVGQVFFLCFFFVTCVFM